MHRLQRRVGRFRINTSIPEVHLLDVQETPIPATPREESLEEEFDRLILKTPFRGHDKAWARIFEICQILDMESLL